MRFIIILFLSLICNLSLFSQNYEYKDQIGEMFYQLGLKTKLKKVDVKDVYKLNYLGFQNMDDIGFHGLHIINDLKTLKKLRSENYITYTEAELFLNENYQNTNTAERVAYSYAISKMGSENNVFDTLIVFNILEGGITPSAFLMSDYARRDINIDEYTAKKEKELYEKRLRLIDTAFNGNEKLIFPNDSIYIYYIKYKKLTDKYKYPISNFNDITFAVTNIRDSELVHQRTDLDKDCLNCESLINEVVLHKALHYKDIYLNDIIIMELNNTSGDVGSYTSHLEFEINDADNFSKYNDILYWIDHADKYLEDKISLSKISLSLYPVENSICLFLNEHVDIDDIPYSHNKNKVTYNKSFCKLLGYDFKKKYDNAVNAYKKVFDYNSIHFNNKSYDLRIDKFDPTFVLFLDDFSHGLSFGNATQVFRYRHLPYGFTKENIVKHFAAKALNTFTYQTASKKRDLEEKEKEEEELKKLYKIYGKKYVDAARNFDIIVGMPEDLLSYPLKLWTIKSRSDFSNGYDLYLYSKLDTSVHLYITVKNKKVSYVSVW